MRRFVRIYKAFLSNAITRETEFRANFITKLLKNSIWTIFFYLLIEVIYQNTQTIAGWARGEALIISGVSMAIGVLIDCCFFELFRLPEHVRRGTLDFILTKPLDPQLWISFRRFNFDQLGAVAASLGLICYGISQATFHTDWVRITAFITLFISGTVLFYCTALMMMTLSIYFVRLDNIWVLATSTLDVARLPNSMYSPVLQKIFIFVFPLAFFGTVPTAILIDRMPLTLVPYGIAVAIIALIGSRLFWNRSLRRYSSASS